MCFTHSRVSEASTVFQLIIFLTLAEDATGQLYLEMDAKTEESYPGIVALAVIQQITYTFLLQ